MKKQRVGMSLNDIEYLKENLRYDPETGEFFRKFHQTRLAAFCWANNNATHFLMPTTWELTLCN